jgi:hypothetical protein
MDAMQYEISLPAGYDMGIIRDRVATNGHILDHFPGLGLKAYLIRDRADGSIINQYAPFYLWNDSVGMNRFLWGGDGFGHICSDFGRPEVRHWAGVGCLPGPDRGGPVHSATRRTELLPPEIDPQALVAEAVAELEKGASESGVHTTALAVDPRTWELVRFTLWTAEPPEDAGTRYQVLHLSTPEIERLDSA